MHMRCCKDIFSYCSQSNTLTGYEIKCPNGVITNEIHTGCDCPLLIPNSVEIPLILTEKEKALQELIKSGKVKLTKKEKKELGIQ